jgi:hypothetical protein
MSFTLKSRMRCVAAYLSILAGSPEHSVHERSRMSAPAAAQQPIEICAYRERLHRGAAGREGRRMRVNARGC